MKISPKIRRAVWKRLDSIARKYKDEGVRVVGVWARHQQGLRRLAKLEAGLQAELRELKRQRLMHRK